MINSIIQNKFYEDYEKSFKKLAKYTLKEIAIPVRESINLDTLVKEYYTIEGKYIESTNVHINTIMRPILSITGKLIYSKIKKDEHIRSTIRDNLNDFIAKHEEDKFKDIMNLEFYIKHFITKYLYNDSEYNKSFNEYCKKINGKIKVIEEVI